MVLKIAFHQDTLCVRGTSVAMYDYALYNEELLHNQSIIIIPNSGIPKCDPLGLSKFQNRFRVLYYTDLEAFLDKEKIDILYCIKYGTNDGIYSRKVKTVIHCVFDMSQPHGDVYAGVSSSVARKYQKDLFVPHMISLKPNNTHNLRDSLNIPKEAIVFGRYGGMDTFNLEFCYEVMARILYEKNNTYFLFINTPCFITHPKVFYLDKISSDQDKNKFIATCDAHLECGTLGHSFGLAIAEFSVNNKPIIAYKSPTLWNTAHLEILKDKALYFSNSQEFYNILNTFKPEDYNNLDLNCYKEYSPENVMGIFKKIFID